MIQPFTWMVQENNFAHVCVSNTDVCFNVRCKYNEFKAKFPNVKSDFLLYERILTAVKCYQRRLG